MCCVSWIVTLVIHGKVVAMTKIVTDLYQSKKQKSIRASERPRGNDAYQGDSRFKEYSSALKRGDNDTCSKMRDEHKDDRILITRFNTLERMWIAEMARYVREIQILLRERNGYQLLTKGYRQKFSGEDKLSVNDTLIRRGNEMLAQTVIAREEHGEIIPPLGFEGLDPC